MLQEDYESSTPAEHQTSADTENDNGNYCLVQTDSNIIITSGIKEEQEELGDDCQTPQVIFPSPVAVKSELDESEMQMTYEMQPVSSDCSEDQSEETDSDGDWVQSQGAQMMKNKQRLNVPQRPNGSMNLTLPDGKSSSKTHRLCPVCGKSFQYIHPLMKHINTHKTYDSAKELLSNLQSAGNKRLVRDVCGKTFTNRGRG